MTTPNLNAYFYCVMVTTVETSAPLLASSILIKCLCSRLCSNKQSYVNFFLGQEGQLMWHNVY